MRSLLNEIGNLWHWIYRDHRHLARGNEEMIICRPRWWWLPGKTKFLYSNDGSEWMEVTLAWLKRLVEMPDKTNK